VAGMKVDMKASHPERLRIAIRSRRPPTPRVQVWNDALVVPPASDRTATGVLVRAERGWSVPAGAELRRWGRPFHDRPGPAEATLADPGRHLPEAVFAGWYEDHYGHFLLESVARLWPTDLDPSVPIVWITDRPELRPWAHEILSIMGIDNEIVLIERSTAPLRVDRLVVPDAATQLRRWIHPTFIERLACRPASPEPGRRIWLSRRSSTRPDRLAQEVDIERGLADLGWTIVLPETLSVSAQLDLLARAEHVAGIEGSAFHGLLLLAGFTGSIDVLTRNRSPNQDLQARAAGWDQRRLDPCGGHRVTVVMGPRMRGEQLLMGTRCDDIDVDATVAMLDASSRRRS
jgi:hypothetical protein